MSTPGISTPLTSDVFAPNVDTSFDLALQAGSASVATLRLLRIEPSKWGRPDGRAAFSLFFEGPPTPALPQGLYWLRHEAMGELELFIVPIDGNANRREYQAVFN